MEIYIVRHAEAEAAAGTGPEADAARALTAKGRERATTAGRAMALLGVVPAAIWTSPLVRARETADLLAAEFSAKPDIREVKALGIEGDFNDLRRLLWEARLPEVVLVGHQPFLGECVAYWLTGRAHPGLHLAKSSIVHLAASGFGREEMEMKFLLSNRLSRILTKQEPEKEE